MAKFKNVGRDLIEQSPITLLALTHHPLEPHEEDWFARCRGDYLRNFPLSLLELVRVTMLLGLVGPMTSRVYAAAALAGWALIMVAQLFVRRKESIAGFDQKLALQYRRETIRLRTVWWCGMLFWAILIAPPSHHEGLVALGVAMMAVDGISVAALPHVALSASLGGAGAITLGMFLRDGIAALPVAVAILVMSAFLHWTIYNIYYLFATRRIRTRRLAESNATIRLLLNQYDDEGSDWLYETDRSGRIRNPSQRFCDACAMPAGLLLDMPLPQLFHEGVHRQELEEKLRRGEAFRNLVVPLTVEGEDRWWSISGRPADDMGGGTVGWRGFIADISIAKQAEAKIAYMAHYDLLTSLPNRTLFGATLERHIARLSRRRILGLLFVDLDHFKQINDGHGHAAGDRVLAEIAGKLELAVRPGDVVARLGGDEFAVLLPDLPSREAGMDIARRILEVIGDSVDVDGQQIPIGASIGAAFGPEHARVGDDLLRAADMAMYDAKLRGRNGISLFDVSLQERMRERRELERALRVAVVEGEFQLHYQPLVDIASGETIGVEALLRWNRPGAGLVGPEQFIPLAEETGIIVEIGEWVIRTALADAADWPAHMTVAVNVSPAQMRDERLVALVANALAASGVAPHRLELEITENLLIQNSDHVLMLLHKLHALGVNITLDDFGTGYSSLTYLHKFPFDKIKIDRSFIQDLNAREDCQAIVQSVISLAGDLNMVTTAEGIENAEQLDALRAKGCAQGQGFLFSKAVPASELVFGSGAAQSAPAVAGIDNLRILRGPGKAGGPDRPSRSGGKDRLTG